MGKLISCTEMKSTDLLGNYFLSVYTVSETS